MDTHMSFQSALLARAVRRLGACAAAAAFAAPAVLHAQDLAIRNATILTITRGDIANGTILVRNGKIVAVGTNVTIPAGVKTIDGTGKFVMPGVIDAHSHAALENGINEGSQSVTPEVQVETKNDDPVIYRALAGGVTAALQLHGSSGLSLVRCYKSAAPLPAAAATRSPTASPDA